MTNYIGGVYSTYGGEVHTALWWGNLRERDHLKYLDLDGRIILKSILKYRDEGMDWINMVLNRDRGGLL